MRQTGVGSKPNIRSSATARRATAGAMAAATAARSLGARDLLHNTRSKATARLSMCRGRGGADRCLHKSADSTPCDKSAQHSKRGTGKHERSEWAEMQQSSTPFPCTLCSRTYSVVGIHYCIKHAPYNTTIMHPHQSLPSISQEMSSPPSNLVQVNEGYERRYTVTVSSALRFCLRRRCCLATPSTLTRHNLPTTTTATTTATAAAAAATFSPTAAALELTALYDRHVGMQVLRSEARHRLLSSQPQHYCKAPPTFTTTPS